MTDAEYIDVAADIVYDFGRNNDWSSFVPEYVATYGLAGTVDPDRLLESILEEVTPRDVRSDTPTAHWGID